MSDFFGIWISCLNFALVIDVLQVYRDSGNSVLWLLSSVFTYGIHTMLDVTRMIT